MSRINDFSPSSSWTMYHSGYYRPGNAQFESDLPPVFHNARSTPGIDYTPFEERLLLRPSRVINRPTRFIIVNNHLDENAMNPIIPPFLRQLTRMPVTHETRSRHIPPTEPNLQRQTYNRVPKTTRRVSLYYRDLNRDANNIKNNKDEEEDGKNCVVCLEEFENGEEVMGTPCKHIFHEECIVPWVKSRGNCPVCRSSLSQTETDTDTDTVEGNRSAVLPANEDYSFSDDHIRSLIRAVDELRV